MLRTIHLSATLAVLSLAASVSAQEIVTPLTSSQIAEAVAGEISVETERGQLNRGQVIGFVDAPIEEVVAIVADSENHDQWFPDTMESTVVATTSSTSTTNGRTHVPLLRDRYWQLNGDRSTTRFNGIECNLLEYMYDTSYEDGNMDELHGYWLICPEGSGVVVKYVINADLGMAMPRAMITWAQNRMLPGIIEELRARHGDVY
ncbi:MAG: hypothetical protein ACJAYU_001444 [Bradymonadia bacterium]|jgi:hypothetical protein